MPTLLVQYGRSAFVGGFTADGDAPPRGTAVVVQSPRGVEIGTVLGPVAERFAGQVNETGGAVLRAITPADEAAVGVAAELAAQILDTADRSGRPVTFLDCEVTLDRRGAVLHVVPWQACDLDPVLAELSDTFGLAVRLLDVSRTPTLQDPPEPKLTCDKPDCGTGEGGCSSCGTGGGCSTGSCSKGSVKSADELTAYFADLRRQMERQPLN